MLFLKLFLWLLTVFVNGNDDHKVSKNCGNLDWWKTSVVYQIYPRSYKDSNGDGLGDLKGIEQQANYLKDLGIETVWLSPIYKSPMADMGYDISDFKAIDPIFGNMDDFTSLINKFKSLGIKVTLDFVPNHSSDEHEWFQKSIKKIDPYTDYYVWKDPKGWINETTPIPPNNWIAIFQTSMWTYNPIRKQFYLHQFAVKQPDLNYRSKALMEEMKGVLRFWLDKGVDGIRADAVPCLVEHADFLDEPIISNLQINGQPAYDAFDHKYTTFQPETFQVLVEFRELLDSYAKKDGQTRLMMVEAYGSLNEIIRFYGNRTNPIGHIPFNFVLLKNFNDTSNAKNLCNIIDSWMESIPHGEWPNWVLGNHDNSRIASKFEPSMVDALNMLLLLLPGTPVTYNGEEIGMQDAKIRWDQTTDVFGLNIGPHLYKTVSRDPERTPMQWDCSIHAGFSKINGKTWLPANPNYYSLNVDAQKSYSWSHLNIYKNLTKLRSNEVFRCGDLKTFSLSEWIFAFKRSLLNQIYVIVINLNNEDEYVHFGESIAYSSLNFTVILTSSNSEYNAGDVLDAAKTDFKMRPKSSIVLKEIPKVG